MVILGIGFGKKSCLQLSMTSKSRNGKKHSIVRILGPQGEKKYSDAGEFICNETIDKTLITLD